MIRVLGVMIFAGLFMALAFKSGQYYEFYRVKPTAIEHSCAHYDTKTGNFTWGAAPVAVEQLDLLKMMPEPKPTVGGKKHG